MSVALEFHLTARQTEALGVSGGPSKHVMYFGGSRSGKTFLHCRNVMMRAVMAPGSRHLIARYRFNAAKTSIALDTFPKMLKLCFSGVNVRLDKTDWYFALENGSEIWIAGLDDGERVEKILGHEFATVYLNECSQIPYSSQQVLLTRLAQRVYAKLEGMDPYLLPVRAYYDCNPPSKAHWTYRLFFEKRDPDGGKPLTDPQSYAHIQMNPESNAENLASDYLESLRNMSAARRKRFLDGEFAEANPNQLFSDIDVEKWRVLDGELPDMVRIVIAVDPSGASEQSEAGDADAIGIIAGAIGTDGNAYVLEDATVLAGPATWGKVAVSLFERLDADIIVGEGNFGGDMVRHVIQTVKTGRPIPFKMVRASRGKVQRAEPFSALYAQGKVRHVGHFHALEDELYAFSTYGYLGQRSPNRADALFWLLAELFPGLVRDKKKNTELELPPMPIGADAWMG